MKAFYQSPVGVLEIKEDKGYITSVAIVPELPVNNDKVDNPLLKNAVSQLEEYFLGRRISFDLPLKQSGTDFQNQAWEYLSSIPYGETVSYKDEAIAIGSPKSCRAVGSANGKNNIMIIVPCHRVINAGGKLGGYAYGLEVKQFLLNIEKQYKNA